MAFNQNFHNSWFPKRMKQEHFGLGADSAWSSQARQAMTCMSVPTTGKAELGKHSERTTSWHSHSQPRKSSSALDIG